MAVLAGIPRNQYAANGIQTVFSYGFEIVTAGDIAVYVNSIRKTLTTDYTVGGVGSNSGGTITFNVAPPNGAVVTFVRDMAFSRGVDYQTAGPAFAGDFNTDSDRHTMAEQQLQEQLNRSIKIGAGFEYQGEDMTIPLTPSQRAGTVLGFNELGGITAIGLPLLTPLALTGNALNMLRVRSDEVAYELRTPLQVLGDIGAAGINLANTFTQNQRINGRVAIGGGAVDGSAPLTFGTGLGFKGVYLYDDGTGISGLGITTNTLNMYSGGSMVKIGVGAVKAGAGSMTDAATFTSAYARIEPGFIHLGGSTSSYAAIKHDGFGGIEFKRADDSAYTTIKTSNILVEIGIQANGSAADIDLQFEPKGAGVVRTKGTRGLVVPTGTTAQRSAVAGSVRLNSTTGRLEATHDGVNWFNLDQTAPDTFGTGDLKPTHKLAADPGWIMWNDGTIGSASSGASIRANADTFNLYSLYYSYGDSLCPVSGGRGASAAADFAANKAIALPRGAGRALSIAGFGSGLTNRPVGSWTGAETHQLSVAEMPSHRHAQVPVAGGLGSSGDPAAASFGGPILGAPTDYTGGDTPHNNMQPTSFINVMIKL